MTTSTLGFSVRALFGRNRPERFARSTTLLAGMSALTLGLASCAVQSGADNADNAASSETTGTSGEVTVLVHDSFPNDEFAAAASAATGFDVKVITAGDGGELTSQLVLTQAAPVADVFFGVDNVFASRLVDAGVSEPHIPAALPERAAANLYDDEGSLVPVTLGATCINIDPAWFAEQGIAEPSSYEDLTNETYKGLTVLLDPATSTTGASFLVGTVAHFGEGSDGATGFADYWQRLAANDIRIEQGWTAAYNGHFTEGGGDGTYPIVLSYSSSPAWTVTEDGSATTTKALLDTCSSQVEYAGVLAGSANPDGAKAVLDFMLSREFQDTIADTMYVYPIDEAAYIPAEWQEFASLPAAPNDLTSAEIGAGRDGWLKQWNAAV